MSTLTYIALTNIECPWMATNDSVVEIDSGIHQGKVIKACITQKQEDINFDGTPDQLNVKISAALVNKTDGTVIQYGGRNIELPGKVSSVSLSAVAEGDVDVVAWMASLLDEAVHRIIRQQAALAAISLIPVEAS